MHTYQIVPLAPLVFRSGRPFGAGSRDGANFPLPSSMAGMLRTAWMDASGTAPDLLLAMAAHGPLLARRGPAGLELQLPKPADALYLPDEASELSVHRLSPGAWPEGCGGDLPAGLSPLVADGAPPQHKPMPGPKYWSLSTLAAWLCGKTPAGDSLPAVDLPVERRTHAALSRTTFAADTGQLFQTEGLDFSGSRRTDGFGFDDNGFVLLARFAQKLSPRHVTLGGERRLSWLDDADTSSAWDMPPDLRNALSTPSTPGFKLVLATPAVFAHGWRPGWIDGKTLEGNWPELPGLRVRLRAVAIERWQGISGWDLKRWQARAARKAVSAGAMYWFDVVNEPPSGSGNLHWTERLWLAPISDDEQDRRDGWGLAVPGHWQATPSGDPNIHRTARAQAKE